MTTVESVRIALERLAPTQEKVDQAIHIAVEEAEPTRVFVFGSWARGDARWNSDIDLAVLVPDAAKSRINLIRHNLRRRLDQLPMTVDLVLATEGYAAGLGESVNALFYQIFKEGKIVYERPNLQPGASTAD
jgi:predicted nucleotidyltransferase